MAGDGARQPAGLTARLGGSRQRDGPSGPSSRRAQGPISALDRPSLVPGLYLTDQNGGQPAIGAGHDYIALPKAVVSAATAGAKNIGF
jgi:hypothetical protein